MTHYLEFLAQLHKTLEPRGYLEIGVRFGDSLRLAKCPAIGVDPAPMVSGWLAPNQVHVQKASDDYFASACWGHAPRPQQLDLAFIDGMHLFEYALRDFINIEMLFGNERTVVAFDDMLPRNQAEASRTQCPGDWTGDVWKVYNILGLYRPDLAKVLVDTAPTGTLLVWDLDQASSVLDDRYDDILAMGLDQWDTVPFEIINRVHAVPPVEALKLLEDR